MADEPLALLLTLLPKALRLLSGLDSDPSTLATLRMVADRASACLVVVLGLPRQGMLFVVRVEAGVRVLAGDVSGAAWSAAAAAAPGSMSASASKGNQ